MYHFRPRVATLVAQRAPAKAQTAYLRCLLTYVAILSMSSDGTGNTFLRVASGLMMRPVWQPGVFLMYAQIAFVTSVRAIFGLPQMAARSALSVFGAKMPLPAFFIARARVFPAAAAALLFRRPSPFTFRGLTTFAFFVFVFLIAFFTVFFTAFLAAFFWAIASSMKAAIVLQARYK